MSDSEKGGLLMRYAGIAGATIGVLAAGAAAGILAERKLVARKRAAAAQPFGSVRGTRHTVVAEDGLELYAEVDEPDRAGDRPVTVVFVHGYALNLDCWHFQRAGHARRAPARALRPALARPLGPIPQRALHDRLPRS